MAAILRPMMPVFPIPVTTTRIFSAASRSRSEAQPPTITTVVAESEAGDAPDEIASVADESDTAHVAIR